MKNRKRTIKFLKFTILCTISGGIIGSLISFIKGSDYMKYSIEDFAIIFPILIIIVTLLQMGIFTYCSSCRKKIKLDGYNSEEAGIYEKIGSHMEFINSLGTTLIAISMPIFFLSLTFGYLPRVYSILCFIIWLLSAGINMINELQMLKTIAHVFPEKDVDWSSIKMQTLYYESLDEFEKEKIGRVGATLITKLHLIFIFTLLFCILLSHFIEFSGMEYILISFLWGGFTLSIAIESRKVEKQKLQKD